MKNSELIKWGIDNLVEHKIENAEYDAKALFSFVAEVNNTTLFFIMNDEATSEVCDKYKEVIAKRATHYPLQYIMGSVAFMLYDFIVDENVLIPRQDTEILVETALKKLEDVKSVRALDMCTGSGCIGISFNLMRKEAGCEDFQVLSDISEGALEIAKKNALKLEASCEIIRSDLFESLTKYSNDGERFDVIMSNPPYIRTEVIETLMKEVKTYEPYNALDGLEDGLYFYKNIIEKAGTFLNENGKLFFEIGYDQYEAVKELLVANSFSNIELYKDYAGLDRVVYAEWHKTSA